MPIEEAPHREHGARKTMTTDDEFAASERSDAVFARVLGQTLGPATLRLVGLLVLISAVAATIAVLA